MKYVPKHSKPRESSEFAEFVKAILEEALGALLATGLEAIIVLIVRAILKA